MCVLNSFKIDMLSHLSLRLQGIPGPVGKNGPKGRQVKDLTKYNPFSFINSALYERSKVKCSQVALIRGKISVKGRYVAL